MPEPRVPLLFPDLNPIAASPAVPDQQQRAEALDIRRSFVVEAPAGSGKTGLLIQRYLKLLGDESVGKPEQVLAITFTKKATAEMRDRVLTRLIEAREEKPCTDEFSRVTRELAQAVLERDRQLGWRLLEQPQRINIRTFDSVCGEIARSLPVLSRSGGRLAPTEDGRTLFEEAARRTMLLLGSAEAAADTEFGRALTDLLLHRDNNLGDCERLMAEMLSVRDQWAMLVPLGRESLEDATLDREVLPRLELALKQIVSAELARIRESFPEDLLGELARIAEEASYAEGYKGEPSPLLPCRGKRHAPGIDPDHLPHWRSLLHLVLTGGKQWRKGFNCNQIGFDIERDHKKKIVGIVDQLKVRNELLDLLSRFAQLPPAEYPEAQWKMAKNLFRVLRRALVELQLVFAERGQCDFTELSLLARGALETNSGRDDLQSALGARIEHLLVDEMQDTSSGQYELIERLTENWDGHSQTVFLVGDPRQSIYLFRQAKVERFLETLRTCRLGDLPLSHLRLTANFRSQRILVEQLNSDLALVFTEEDTAPGVSPIPFQRADAVLPAMADAAGLRWHANPVHVRGRRSSPDAAKDEPSDAQLRHRQTRQNAERIRQIAREWQARPLPQGRTDPWKLAVLVRNRAHLTEVVAALRAESEEAPVPFRAVEIDALGERREILDLVALTRILLHPADRVAGFALLRAPWCGLSLADLHQLAGADDTTQKRRTVQRLMEERGHLLSADGCRQMQRLWNVLQAATHQRGRLSLAAQVEFAWKSLGGDAALNAVELTNARRYLELLDALVTEAAQAGMPVDLARLERRMQRLYAEPAPVPPGTVFVELLTIHRAKGLEWDVVMVPALERRQGRTSARLLHWAELEVGGEPGSEGDVTAASVMLAPLARLGEKDEQLTRWLKEIHKAHEAAERKRLFYVAATRARQELHLFASPDAKSDGTPNIAWDSLLNSARAAAEPHFSGRARMETAVAEPIAASEPVGDIAAGATLYEMPRRSAGAGDSDASDVEDTKTGEAEDALEQSMYIAPVRPAIERLPQSFDPAARLAAARAERLNFDVPHAYAGEREETRSLTRPEGSFAARAFGNTVHTLLEGVARQIAAGAAVGELLAGITAWSSRAENLLRGEGLARSEAKTLAREAVGAVAATLADPVGAWVLGARNQGATEVALTAVESGRVASIRVDRLFRAGSEPQAAGDEHLWIVDYKTATYAGSGRSSFLEQQRRTYAAQLEHYARVLGAVYGINPAQIRVALYYPLLPHLTWWTPGESRESDAAEQLTLA